MRLLILISCSVLIATSCFAKELYQSPNLAKVFESLSDSFRSGQRSNVKLLSGPVEVAMLRDKSPGKMWQAELGAVKFRITIENKLNLKIEDVLGRLTKIPESYRRAYVIVSEDKKDGVAFYADLDGAVAHGSENYLNMVSDVNAEVIAHEVGHILEQRYSLKHPDTLKKWEAAIESDKVSVSDYGDGAVHEDLAEFAFVYALCCDAGKAQLSELKSKSPQRYSLWEAILFEKS